MAGSVLVFGSFEFDTGSGELKKHDVTIPLPDQAGRVLAILLARPGEVVTRETFEREVWKDTAVKFPTALNTAIARVRDALGEDYRRHLKTVRNEGYRFDAIVAVKTSATEPQVPSDAPCQVVMPEQIARRSATTTLPTGWAAAGLTAVCAGLAVFFLSNNARSPVPIVARITQITNDGEPKTPYLVTYGDQIYFGEMANRTLRLRRVDETGGKVTDAAYSFQGHWPNPVDSDVAHGKLLLRIDSGLVAWSPQSNEVRSISNLGCDVARWSPDRRTIACSVGGELYLLDAFGAWQRLVKRMIDIQDLAWTPDGKEIRYSGQLHIGEPLRLREFSVEDNSDVSAGGADTEETIGNVFLKNEWLYVSGRDNNIYAKQMGSTPLALTNGPVQFYSLQVDRVHDVLVALGDTRRGQLVYFDAHSDAWRPYLHGISADCLAWSPDHAYLAYVTYPERELWISHLDGSDALQLTRHPLQVYHPSWSPDGKRLAYEARVYRGVWRLHVTGRHGEGSEEITQGNQPNLQQREPVWSPDGRTIVFTTRPDATPREQLGLYSVDLATRNIKRLPGTDELSSPRWAPDGSGLLALTRKNEIVFYDFHTKRIRTLTDAHKAWPNWSKDGQRVCFLDGVRQMLSCVPVKGGSVVDIAPVPFTPTGNVFSPGWNYNFWAGFTPDADPVLLKDVGHAEVYALNLRWR